MNPIPHAKGLDIARFFAAALVLLAHANFHLMELHIAWHNEQPFMRQGAMAVSFFFSLSGFLLTCLGIQECLRNGALNIKKFYYRRMLRVWPLYYFTVLLCFLTGFVLLPLFYPSFAVRLPMPVSLLCTVFFIPNYLTANGISNLGSINGLWSIGVEELFYLLFPLLFLFYKRIRNFALLFLVLLILYLFFYWSIPSAKRLLPPELIRFLRTYVFQYMLTGCFFAAVWMQFRDNRRTMRWLMWLSGLLALAAALLIATRVWSNSMSYAVLFAVAILFIAQLPNRLFDNNPLVYFGRISYGIYLLHPFAGYLLRALYARSAVFSNAVRAMPSLYFLLLLAITIGAAHLSYQWLELRFLRMKDKPGAV